MNVLPSAAPLWMIAEAHKTSRMVGVTALRLAHRASFVASGGAGGELRVWDTRSREMVANMKQHTAPINDIAVLADDIHLVRAITGSNPTMLPIIFVLLGYFLYYTGTLMLCCVVLCCVVLCCVVLCCVVLCCVVLCCVVLS